MVTSYCMSNNGLFQVGDRHCKSSYGPTHNSKECYMKIIIYYSIFHPNYSVTRKFVALAGDALLQDLEQVDLLATNYSTQALSLTNVQITLVFMLSS